jgi:hypothetical protein
MPAITPPYRPRFGNGAPSGGAAQGTLYFDVQNNYQSYIFQGSQWRLSGQVILGAGVPTFAAPPGTLYSRNDGTPGLYASNAGLAADTVVQFAHTAGHGVPGAPTFGSAVTTGNLLLAYLGSSLNQSAALNLVDWTLLDNLSVSSISALVAYRYAQAGDGATPPAVCLTGNPFWGMEMIELSGVTGNINVDIVHHLLEGSGSTFNTTTPQDTTAANQLALLGLMAYDATANVTNPSGFTLLEQWNDGAADYGAMTFGKQTPASGTDVGGATMTRPSGSNGDNYASTIILASSLVESWTLIGP